MKYTRKQQQVKSIDVYINVSAEKHETLFSGITFVDFIECAPTSIKNIILLQSGYFAKKNWRGFELLEGKDEISELSQEDIRNYGNFSFIDYADTDSINQLSDEQIAELLYLAHTHEPLKSPFFEVLQNRFVYLSHDDGWYCKLYCKDWQVPISILINKLQENVRAALRKNEYMLPVDVVKEIQRLSTKGLLVSLELSAQEQNICTMKLYEVGKYENPDTLFNSIETNTLPVSLVMQLS